MKQTLIDKFWELWNGMPVVYLGGVRAYFRWKTGRAVEGVDYYSCD